VGLAGVEQPVATALDRVEVERGRLRSRRDRRRRGRVDVDASLVRSLTPYLADPPPPSLQSPSALSQPSIIGSPLALQPLDLRR
jgi:hypothetical protein